jgi:quinol monooxygenase YgiN
MKTMKLTVEVEIRADEDDEDSIQAAVVDKLEEMIEDHRENETLIDYEIVETDED